jgi:hypothetical protein
MSRNFFASSSPSIQSVAADRERSSFSGRH